MLDLTLRASFLPGEKEQPLLGSQFDANQEHKYFVESLHSFLLGVAKVLTK